jgi:hypothetical protein
MDTSTIVLELVVDRDNDSITPVGFDGGTGHLAVYEQNDPLNSIWRKCGIRDIEVVCNRVARLRDEIVVIGADISSAVRQ